MKIIFIEFCYISATIDIEHVIILSLCLSVQSFHYQVKNIFILTFLRGQKLAQIDSSVNNELSLSDWGPHAKHDGNGTEKDIKQKV